MDKMYSEEMNGLAPWVKGVPKHQEGHEIIRDYVKKNCFGNDSNLVLDIGSGDGATIFAVSQGIKDAVFHALDYKGTNKVKKEIKDKVEVIEIGSSIENIGLGVNNYNAITSSFAIHHVGSTNRQEVYNKIFEAIIPGGVFCLFDVREVDLETEKAFMEFYVNNSGMDKEDAKSRYMKLVGPEMLEYGVASNENKDKYEDKHLKLEEYIEHIKNAGFVIEEIKLWEDGLPENKKIFLILAKKPS